MFKKNLASWGRNLHMKNYRASIKEIENGMNKWKQVIYIFNISPIKIPVAFSQTTKYNSNTYVKLQKTLIG